MALNLIDMANEPEEMKEATVAPPVSDMPLYPWNLCISLTENELEKLGLDTDCEVGSYLEIHAMARVTSVSENESQSGKHCRVELQIEQMAAVDQEEEGESPEEEASERRPLNYSPYGRR